MQEGKAKVVDETLEQREDDELLPILKKLSLFLSNCFLISSEN